MGKWSHVKCRIVLSGLGGRGVGLEVGVRVGARGGGGH